jgi:ABC-2 type transport system permease protein
MKKFFIIFKHEFKVFAMNKTFIVLTILGPFFLFAISILPTILTTNMSKAVTLVVSGDPVDIVDLVTISLRQTSIKVLNEDQLIDLLKSNKKYRDNKSIQEKIDIASNKNDRNTMVSLFDFATSSKIIDGYLYLDADIMQSNKAELVLKDVADFTTVGTVQYVLQQVLSSLRLVENGMDPGLVQKLVVQPEIIVKQISEKGKIKQDFLTVLMTGLGFSLLVYMTILLYGQSIGRAVLTEKTSKTVEVLLSSTKPLNILYGKIFGQGLLLFCNILSG